MGNLTYAYDEAGRRTALGGTWARTGLPQPLGSASYNASNQLTQWGAAPLTYDANGNLTSDGTDTYAWDARNQMASISGVNTASFLYDALGRRARKSVNGATTEFLYDGLNPVQEKDGAVVIANLLTGLGVDEYFTRTDVAWQQNFLTDGLGSTVALADATRIVATEYAYEPFGKTTVSGAATTNSLQYTGRESDGSGLYHFRTRYYDSQYQRFIAEDTIGFEGGINLYAYVADDPMNLTDPLGLKPKPSPGPSSPQPPCPEPPRPGNPPDLRPPTPKSPPNLPPKCSGGAGSCAGQALKACGLVGGPLFLTGIAIGEICLEACVLSGPAYLECALACLGATGIVEELGVGACLVAAGATYAHCQWTLPQRCQ